MIERVDVSMGRFDNLIFRMRTKFLQQKAITANNIKDVPVIINNFNRLSCLQEQLEWLEKMGMKNIYIIDNASTYPPLLAYYKQIKHRVFLLNKNAGFMALWKTILFQRFRKGYYIYTDPDIIPVQDCPADVMSHFYSLLQQYPDADKVGFGLVIDDLPDHYPLKEKVIAWESKYWQEKREENVYVAPIDTTFAIYRPGAQGGSELNALRTGGVYTARHLSWYVDTANLPEEELYYMEKAGKSSSWTSELLGKKRTIQY